MSRWVGRSFGMCSLELASLFLKNTVIRSEANMYIFVLKKPLIPNGCKHIVQSVFWFDVQKFRLRSNKTNGHNLGGTLLTSHLSHCGKFPLVWCAKKRLRSNKTNSRNLRGGDTFNLLIVTAIKLGISHPLNFTQRRYKTKSQNTNTKYIKGHLLFVTATRLVTTQNCPKEIQTLIQIIQIQLFSPKKAAASRSNRFKVN